MRSMTSVRNYCLLVFFVVLVGGVLLQPANRELTKVTSDTPAHAGFGQ